MDNKILQDQFSITNTVNLGWLKGFVGLTTLESVLKWLAVGGLVLYSLFALVIIKQVAIMAETFEGDANSIIKLFAWAHFLMAVGLVVAVILLV